MTNGNIKLMDMSLEDTSSLKTIAGKVNWPTLVSAKGKKVKVKVKHLI